MQTPNKNILHISQFHSLATAKSEVTVKLISQYDNVMVVKLYNWLILKIAYFSIVHQNNP